MKKNIKKSFLALISFIMILSVFGCTKSNSTSNKEKEKINNTVATDKKDNSKNNSKNDLKNDSKKEKDDKKDITEEEKEVTLYFSDEEAMYLVPEVRNIKNPLPLNVVEELIRGPENKKEHFRTLSEKAKVLDVEVKDNIAYVNFNKAMQDAAKGSTGETMAIYAVVNTLTENKGLNIKKVCFLIEGEKIDTLSGHMDLSEPLEFNKDMMKK